MSIRFSGPAAGDGDTGTADVWVWEAGGDAEAYRVLVREQGQPWTVVGDSDQETHGSQGFDVDHAGFNEQSQIIAIRIVDQNNAGKSPCVAGNGNQEGFYIQGSDIDAVGVVTRGLEADLAIVKSHDVTDATTLNVGDTITYSFDVENTGTVPLTNVTVTDPMIDAADIDCGDGTNVVASLAAAATVTCTAPYDVTLADMDAGEIVNQASVTGDPPDDCTVCEIPNVPSNEVIIPLEQAPAITIDKESDVDVAGGDTVAPGDTITYTFDVENTGNVTLTDVTVTDPLVTDIAPVAPLTEPVTLEPGETAQFSGTYEVTGNNVVDGEVENTAEATGNPPDTCEGCEPPTAEDTEIVPTDDPAPAITIDKRSNVAPGETVSVGDSVTYIFEVTNTGNVPLTDVVVSDSMIAEDDWLSGPDIGTLGVGESATVRATYIVQDTDGDQIENTATATGTCGTECQVSDDDTTVVPPEELTPGLTIEKSANTAGPVAIGDTITYTITVTNTGNVDLQNVVVSDSMIGDDEWAADSNPNIGALAAGSDPVVLTVTHEVTEADVDDNGNVVNSATVDCDDAICDEVPPAIVIIPLADPGISIIKDSDIVFPAPVGEDDTITYTFTVENTGNVDLTNVEITDTMLASTDWDAPGPVIGDLAVGETVTRTATYTVTTADVEALGIPNTATVTGVCGDDCTVDDTDNEFVLTEDSDPALTIEKTADTAGPVAVGDTITYTITVTNTGNITLEDVVVTDAMIDGDEWVTDPAIGTLGIGDAVILTANHEVTEADVNDDGNVVNTATVDCTDTICDDPPGDTIVIPLEDPGLTIEKTANTAGPVAIGDTIEYTIVVTNTGNVDLDNVVVSDPMIATDEWTDESNPTIGTLVVDQVVTLTANHVVTAADVNDDGDVVNSASVNCDDPVCEDEPPAIASSRSKIPASALTRTAMSTCPTRSARATR